MPSHRIQALFNVTQHHYNYVSQDGTNVMSFDSNDAVLHPLDYWKGFVGGTVQGFYSKLKYKNSPIGPSIYWAVYLFDDKTECIIGNVVNESMEHPLGRLVGTLNVRIDDNIVVDGEVELYDRTGCAFILGEPRRLLKWMHLLPKLRTFARTLSIPESIFATRKTVPDSIDPDVWYADYNPQVRTYDKRYQGNWENPDITAMLNGIPVARWEKRYTWYDRLKRNEFNTIFFTGWRSIEEEKRAGTRSKEELNKIEKDLLTSLNDWVAAQAGCFSPNLPGKFLCGRTSQLSLDDGTLWEANKKYNLNSYDKSLPFAAVLVDGMPILNKDGYQFSETYQRRDEKVIPWVEAHGYRWGGGHQTPNSSNDAQRETEKLKMAAMITGNVIAIRHLHNIVEEIVSNKVNDYRSSMWGWNCNSLLNGWHFFGNNKYLIKARDYLRRLQDNKVSSTPYKALLTKKYWDVKIQSPYVGQESIAEISPCIYACVQGYRLDPDPVYRAAWLALAKYGVECVMQPGVVDLYLGGIIGSYYIGGPAVDSTKTVGERLEITSNDSTRRIAHYPQCPVSSAIAAYVLETGDNTVREWLKPLWQAQSKAKWGKRDVPLFSNESEDAWGWYYELIALFGKG